MLFIVTAGVAQAVEPNATANAAANTQQASPGVAWSQLTAEQQSLLTGVQAQWDQIPPGRQVAMARGAQRFLEMNDKQRELAKERFVEWNNLTDAERTAIRQRFAEFRNLPPEEKERIRQAVRRFQNLPPEQRQRLRQRFQSMTPEERQRAREFVRQRRETRK